jgi:hypothetical protein
VTTGTPVVPTPFSPTLVRPSVASANRTLPYVSASDYRFAPTAVGTSMLVPNSATQPEDSTASLIRVLARASSWVDTIVFKRFPTAGFQANVVIEQDYVGVKPDGGFKLICNLKPVLECTGVMIGSMPGSMSNIAPTIASNIWIQERIIHIPAAWSTTPLPLYAYPVDTANKIYVTWSYVNGFPNFAVAPSPSGSPVNIIPAGATQLVITPPVPGLTTLPGVYANSVLLISDGAASEYVSVAANPNSLNISLLGGGTKFQHTVPPAPDFLRITALPDDVEQATVHLASVLIKTLGSRAFVMPGSPGGLPTTQAMSLAGSLGEYQQARAMLKPYEIVYLHG